MKRITTIEGNILEIDKKNSIYGMDYYHIIYRSDTIFDNNTILDIKLSKSNMECILDSIADIRFIRICGVEYIKYFRDSKIMIIDFEDIYRGQLLLDHGIPDVYSFTYTDRAGGAVTLSIHDKDIGPLSMDGRFDRVNDRMRLEDKNDDSYYGNFGWR